MTRRRAETTADGPPFLDLGRRWEPRAKQVAAAAERVARSGRVLLGEETEAFERELATWCGRAHAVAVSSGTEALRLVLAALGIGPGHEVIVPALTAVPTAAAVCAAGADPVFADVEIETATLDPGAAARAVSPHTRAVIPVHLYGRPARLPDLGVPVIEDAAQGHGACDPGSPSAAQVYSFYPTKNLGGLGDGGAVVTDDDALAAAVRLRRAHGLSHGYEHTAIATNARMSEFEAAVLRLVLPDLASWNERRRAIAARYREAAPGLRWQEPHSRHVYHLCVGRPGDRERWRASRSFGTAVQYPLTLGQQPAYREFVREPCPQAEAWAAECVSVPCFPELSDDEVEQVCRALR